MSHLLVHRTGSNYFIRPRASASAPLSQDAFDVEALAHQQRLIQSAPGRGLAWFFQDAQRTLVLRHYCRGGLAARVSKDHYVWQGLSRSRPWRELTLTQALHEHGLPVPVPVAARVCRSGLFYQGDIITECIPHAVALADHPRPKTLDWAAIGATIARFHNAGVGHADLNARNILIDAQEMSWLIDWDRGIERASHRQQRQSLARLRRSMTRFSALEAIAETVWPQLMNAYRAAC